MTHTKQAKNRSLGEPDTPTALHHLMTDAPITAAQHTRQQVKRGDTRRKVEDLLLSKVTEDLW